MATVSETVDLKALAQVHQRSWSQGEFGMVAALIMMVSEELVEALEVLAGERVLDVACGTGNGALAAARRSWGNVVGVDFVPALLERARERAECERLEVEFVEAEASGLPFEDGQFDVVMSVFGVMFAPDQERAAAELLRVCRPGGRIGLANWVPDGSGGDLFATIARHLPPPPGVMPPTLWGTEDRLRELFGDGITELRLERKASRQTFRSPEHWLEFFRAYFGPMQAAFARVGPEGEEALAGDLLDYVRRHNAGREDAVVLEPEYLEVVATRA